jgi:hypothetical protein
MQMRLTKLLQLTQLYDNINPFTEAVVGDWVLPDEVLATTARRHSTKMEYMTARAAAA